MGYIYCPDNVQDNDNIYCSACGQAAILANLPRRATVQQWIQAIARHETCQASLPGAAAETDYR